jgi:RNA recognition motif-containing protein
MCPFLRSFVQNSDMDIYVGSIPFKWKEKHLTELFSPFGTVTSATIIIDNITRQNKGFAFVVMPNEEEAMIAIEALNGTEHYGREIIVSVSQEKSQQKNKKPFGRGGSKRKFSGPKSGGSRPPRNR